MPKREYRQFAQFEKHSYTIASPLSTSFEPKFFAIIAIFRPKSTGNLSRYPL
ncbi:hypothetical protein FD12_GL002388 [Lentilactobacillus rapi DSM 19907 = JCM 15042]|uniref:Uncharacterized protein n=1 Tax=Lentilactobacillus rapi DSM 19907 = JCM 15042 TaxID=1423795 RepID=A0ABR5PDA8_9LACO|nr:hypothetical protein FD12_GL002388 [Lentilactobacillus rapi DSM 19907 = JCM 15042]